MDEMLVADSPTQGVSERGIPTGVEVEIIADSTDPVARVEHAIFKPFDPDKIDVVTRSTTVDLLLSRIRSGAIDLAPDFQRQAGIWDHRRKSRLIESLLLRIPVPTFYAAENEDEDWAIVDGIQRLTTIAQFMEPSLVQREPLRLANLEYLGREYDGLTYEELPARLQLRLRETEFVLHLIRRGTPEPVKFNIFARINTGGLRLSAQELRHALIGGPIRERLRRMAASDAFQEATARGVRDDRMADREMVLRYLAFREIDPLSYSAQDFDGFLTETMRRHTNLPDGEFAKLEREFDEVMRCCAGTFKQFAFRKVWSLKANRSPINRALFEAVAVGVAELDKRGRGRLEERGDRALDAVIALMDDAKFFSSISSGTGDSAKVHYRFRVMADTLKGISND
jgi:hypothetical protein